MPPYYKLLCALTPVLSGDSTLGTINSTELDRFLDGPKPGGSIWPWGSRDANNTNPYDPKAIPNTGITRQYDWHITNTTMAPDGVKTPMVSMHSLSDSTQTLTRSSWSSTTSSLAP